jgi:ribA/ribD-fused uncharacterized protein
MGDDTTPIRFYDKHRPYYWLTNFAPYAVFADGVIWPTAEHYYQAQKFEAAAMREQIRRADGPRRAFQLGQSQEGRVRRWHEQCLDVMLTVLRLKFAQHPDLAAELLDTGERILVEASPKDSFFGEGADGKGHNHLGRLLMQVRAELREARVQCTCPRCGHAGVPIVYGLPSGTAFGAAERGEVVLGGCVIEPDAPTFSCLACGERWRSPSLSRPIERDD